MKKFTITILALISIALSACGSKAESADASSGLNGSAQQGPTSVPRGAREHKKDALIFEGTAAWQPEVAAVKDILSSHGATFESVTSSEMDSLSLDDISQFGTIIWPGGYGNQQTNSLSSATRLKLRQAVQDRGVSWIGFCAGAFVAVNPTPADGKDPEYGLAIVNGPMLKYYYLEDEFVKQGRESEDYTMIEHTFADGSKRSIVWYGGPVTPNAGVIAKYPTGDPAISQVWSGNGFVVLSATHPSVSASVLGLTDPDGSDQDVAWKLISAAIQRTELQAF